MVASDPLCALLGIAQATKARAVRRLNQQAPPRTRRARYIAHSRLCEAPEVLREAAARGP